MTAADIYHEARAFPHRAPLQMTAGHAVVTRGVMVRSQHRTQLSPARVDSLIRLQTATARTRQLRAQPLCSSRSTFWPYRHGRQQNP